MRLGDDEDYYDDEDDVQASTPAIDIGDSSAVIQVEGTNSIRQDYYDNYDYGENALLHVADGDLTLTSETGGSLTLQNGDSNGAVIGSGYKEDFTGSIHVTGNLQLTAGSEVGTADGAGIGSGEYGAMSGTITIDGEAVVHAAAQDNGAGIGSGEYGAMSGTIAIGGNAQVTATNDNDGAGIGSGEDGAMSGTITIGGNAQVTAWSEDRGAGIGSGENGAMSGTIRIGGNAQVTAGSDDNSAGIGAGEEGSVSQSGQIILCDDAKVTAIGEGQGAGIGAGEDHEMAGLILIRDRAQVTAIAGDCAAAIGSDDQNEMTGSIVILGDAVITTGVESGVWFDEETQQIQYDLEYGAIGYIGDSQNSNHDSANGQYVIGPGVTINGVPGAETEELLDYVNVQVENGETKNLTTLDVEVENGLFTAKASGAGAVLGIYYGGSKTVPTEPGSYTVTCLLDFGGGNTLTVELGTYVVAEAETEAPLYRVLDEAGRDTAYTAEQSDGVLTITVDRAYAELTGRCDAMETLRQQGVETIVFVTKEATSTFALADLLEKGTGAAQFHLTHVGPTVTFTLGDAMTDISAILA